MISLFLVWKWVVLERHQPNSSYRPCSEHGEESPGLRLGNRTAHNYSKIPPSCLAELGTAIPATGPVGSSPNEARRHQHEPSVGDESGADSAACVVSTTNYSPHNKLIVIYNQAPSAELLLSSSLWSILQSQSAASTRDYDVRVLLNPIVDMPRMRTSVESRV